MKMKKTGRSIEVDIHGLTADEAKKRLEHILSGAAPDVEEVRVIHGYNSGQALLTMVRQKLKHPRIEAKILSLNPGETRLLLKSKK